MRTSVPGVELSSSESGVVLAVAGRDPQSLSKRRNKRSNGAFKQSVAPHLNDTVAV